MQNQLGTSCGLQISELQHDHGPAPNVCSWLVFSLLFKSFYGFTDITEADTSAHMVVAASFAAARCIGCTAGDDGSAIVGLGSCCQDNTIDETLSSSPLFLHVQLAARITGIAMPNRVGFSAEATA
jgi:hypothetical protein